MAAEGAALRLWESQLRRIACLDRRSTRLEDGVFLRAAGGPRDLLRPLHRQAEQLRATEKHVLLRSHGRGLNRKRMLDPLVIGNQFAVAEGEKVCRIVGGAVVSLITGKRARHGSRRSEEHTSELQSRQYLVCR